MSPPAKSTRTERNDARIRDAAARLAAVDGWTALMFHHVAAEAGLSVRPVRERYADRASLAADLWRTEFEHDFVADMDAVIKATDACSPDGLARANIPFTRPAHTMLGIAELLIVASFAPVLREAITETFTKAEWLTSEMPRAQAARRAYSLSVSLGCLIMARNRGFSVPDLGPYFGRVSAALSADPPARPLPPVDAVHLDQPPQFDTGDPAWEALLAAAMDTIGEVGFDSATVQQIARKSGRTEGLLFSHYPSKRALFTDAALRSATSGYPANEAFQEVLRDHYSPGIAEAVTIREFMKPTRARIRAFYLEQMRVAWHDSELNQAANSVADSFLESTASSEAAAFVEQALGIGILVLATVQPDAWSLPWDVVTVPLSD